jgi:hypothetical protein
MRKERKFDERGFARLEADLMQSRAFWAIRSANGVRVLCRFWQKRRFLKKKRRAGRSDEITNQGKILFTSAEAAELGIASRSTFLRLVKELVELGFIDIHPEDQGGFRPGYGHTPTRFRISQRWRLYGKPGFEARKKERVLPDGLGFAKGNEAWSTSKR